MYINFLKIYCLRYFDSFNSLTRVLQNSTLGELTFSGRGVDCDGPQHPEKEKRGPHPGAPEARVAACWHDDSSYSHNALTALLIATQPGLDARQAGRRAGQVLCWSVLRGLLGALCRPGSETALVEMAELKGRCRLSSPRSNRRTGEGKGGALREGGSEKVATDKVGWTIGRLK